MKLKNHLMILNTKVIKKNFKSKLKSSCKTAFFFISLVIVIKQLNDMKTRQFTYKQRAYLSEEEFNNYKNKYIEKLNKRKKVVKAEDKTLGDYIKEPFNYSSRFDLDNQEDFIIEITNPEHMIGTLFTYEDNSQKFAFYTAWGPETTLSGKNKGLTLKYYQSNSITDKNIRNVLVNGWILGEIYNIIKLQKYIDKTEPDMDMFLVNHYKLIKSTLL